MNYSEIQTTKKKLVDFVAEFSPLFGHKKRTYWCETYLSGLMPTPTPTPQEVCALLERIQTKIVRFLSRKGSLRQDLSQGETSGAISPESSPEESTEQQLLSAIQGCSTQNRFALFPSTWQTRQTR